MRLCVAKGTLVPAKTLRCGHPQACHPRQARRRISQQLGLSAETIPHISHISPIASITSDYFRSLLGAQGGEQQDQSILGELQGGLAADLGSISTDEISTSVDELALFNEVAGLSSLRPSVASRSSSMSLNADLLTAASDGPKARAKPEQGVDLEADLEADLDHDLTSMIEGWKASQAAGGGTADDSLDVSRASTVCRGLQGMGLGGERSELGLDDSTLGLLNANQASPDRASPDLSRSSSVGTIVASQSHGRIAAPATDDASEAPECASCWGAQINGGATCMPQFVPGKLHFKNKFCDNCRHSVVVPASRVCALTAELAACFVNKRSEGFWNRAPASMGGGQYRIINNTAGSVGPRLALFRDQPPPQFYWQATLEIEPSPLAFVPGPFPAGLLTLASHRPCDLTTPLSLSPCRPTLPEQWVTNGSYVRLCVAKGTLVPAKALRPYHPQASRALASAYPRWLEPLPTPQALDPAPFFSRTFLNPHLRFSHRYIPTLTLTLSRPPNPTPLSPPPPPRFAPRRSGPVVGWISGEIRRGADATRDKTR